MSRHDKRITEADQVYAVLLRDNWDGEGDTYHILATKNDEGTWLSEESGKPLIKYEGDEILEVWPLTKAVVEQRVSHEIPDGYVLLKRSEVANVALIAENATSSFGSGTGIMPKALRTIKRKIDAMLKQD